MRAKAENPSSSQLRMAPVQPAVAETLSHLCLFYKEAAELWQLCAPLIQTSRQAGLAWFYVVDEHGPDEVMAALASATRPSAGQVVDADILSFLDTPLSIDRIMSQLQSQVETTLAQGAAGLLVFIEMTWALRTSSGPAYLGEFEVALHGLLTSLPLRAVCLYNLRVLPESLLLVGLRTHPDICASDGLHRNPHFLPPAVFLSGSKQAQLQCWLGAISPTLTEPDAPAKTVAVADKPASRNTRPQETNTKTPIYSLESPAPLAAANTDQQRWKIHCLGRLRVERQDGQPVKWNVVNGATLKTKTLFTYLLHRGQEGATIEEIANLLWPEANSVEIGLNRLYHTVHCLRMALSPELTSSRHSPFVLQHDQRYFLALPHGTWIDIPVFEQLCYRGDRLRRNNDDEHALICSLAAEKLYNGDLLQDIPLEYAANIEQDWCWSRRYWLREMYLKLLSDIATSYRRQENIPSALAYCERALRIDPYTDMAHQEMMRIFHATGRRDALNRQYRLYCQALERFDSSAPSATTRALYESLLATF